MYLFKIEIPVKINQTIASKVIGITQPTLSNILNGKVACRKVVAFCITLTGVATRVLGVAEILAERSGCPATLAVILCATVGVAEFATSATAAIAEKSNDFFIIIKLYK